MQASPAPGIVAGARRRSQGAELTREGVHYRTWSQASRVAAGICTSDGKILRAVAMTAEGDGYFSGLDSLGKAGDLYKYELDDGDHLPDPASRFQPAGVHGPSLVVDPTEFQWTDVKGSRPPLGGLIIYELHVGTFTPAGTFTAAIEKLDHLVALGVNAIELMPVADFPGERNWGYDGVMLYAPARAYGAPDDLRRLVDAAHAHGLAVILDVVYNHLGPDGNYVGCYHSQYFNPRQKTPWGDGFNFEQAAVRAFFAENPPYWMREFHIDGFRLDATHAIADKSEAHILREIAVRIHEDGGFVIAEDERNDPALLRGVFDGGMGIDGCWSDDFHHVVRVMTTHQREGYYRNFAGTAAELAETLQHGWLFRGQQRPEDGDPRGGETAGLAPYQFIYCISNHDQVGNRAFGDRLGHVIDAAVYRAASALLCFVPQTPMLFMGQEWNASTPFQFFTDHNPDLGAKVTAGRRREFRHFADFAASERLQLIPDPQDPQTFRNSRLRWEEIRASPHAELLNLYRECFRLRRTQAHSRANPFSALQIVRGITAVVWRREGRPTLAMMVDLLGTGADLQQVLSQFPPELSAAWTPIFSSNEARFGGGGEAPFTAPSTLLLEAE